jgi:hypothetical protein
MKLLLVLEKDPCGFYAYISAEFQKAGRYAARE